MMSDTRKEKVYAAMFGLTIKRDEAPDCAVMDLITAIDAAIEYRNKAGAVGFQLEKFDDYLKRLNDARTKFVKTV